MSLFDPKKTRQSLLDVVLPMELEERIETYQPNSVGNAAIQRLHGVIESWLVGLEREFQPILEATEKWLVASVQLREKFGANESYHESQKWEALALCKWMLTGNTCSDSLEKALAAKEEAWVQERRLRGAASARDLAHADLPGYVAICLQLGRPEQGLVQLKSWEVSPRSGEDLQFSLLACESFSNGASHLPTFSSLRSDYLGRNLQGNWLGHGQSLRAASWLKSLLWLDGSSFSPIATLRLAYDYMPNVIAPSV